MSKTKIERPEGYEGESQNKTFEFDVCDLITLEEYGIKNIREEYPEQKFKELLESIRSEGIKEAGQGFRHPEDKTKVVVFKGHHRVKAGRIIEKEENRPVRFSIKIRDCRKWNEADFIAEMYVENSLRADMTPFENALTVKRLVEAGLTHEEVAKKLSKHRVDGYLDLGYVRNSLILCEAPPAVLDLVKSGDLAASEVVKLKKKNDDWKTVETIIFKAQEKRDEVLEQKTAPSKQKSRKIMTRHIAAAASETQQAENLIDGSKELKKAFKLFEKQDISAKDIKDPVKREVFERMRMTYKSMWTAKDIDNYFFQ